ncbi:MAG: hypothetical protein CMO34_00615 [Verrucomicrobia bacterium]|nr:hypothetical protein [Verrucomicrobiota bacterium]
MNISQSLTILSCYLLISIGTTAQEAAKSTPEKAQKEITTYVGHSFFPQKKNIGLSIVMNGLIDNIQFNSAQNSIGQNILFGRYYLENDLAFRAGLGFDWGRIKRQTADSVGQTLVEKDSLVNQFVFNLSFGLEKHISTTNRIDPYVFAQIDLTFIGKTTTEINGRTVSAAGTARDDRTIKQDGGLGFGLNAGGGFNYFLARNFSLGTELAFQLQIVKEGGTIADNQIITPLNGSTISNFQRREDQINQTTLNVLPTASINISYFF